MMKVDPEERHRLLREASAAALHSPEFRAEVDALLERVATSKPPSLPRRKTDEQSDYDSDREEGGPDIVGNPYA